MKSNAIIVILTALAFSACEQKNLAIQNELSVIEKTAKDATQTNYIRESARTFADILSEKQGITDSKLGRAHYEMARSRNETTIATYVAFLKALEKKIPDILPEVDAYEGMKDKAGKATIIEYNVAKTIIIMSNSIGNISLYSDPTADAELEEVLKRLNEKHGNSETGKKILKLFNMEHENGLQDREKGIKPWESPRKPDGYID